ncbi:hypothetical protein [Terrisporobacter sp.]
MDYYKKLYDEFNQVSGSNIVENLNIIISITRKYADAIRLLQKSGLLHFVLEQLNSSFDTNKPNYRLVLWNGIIYNIIFSWVKTDMHETNEEIVNKIMEALEEVANSVIHNSLI